MQFCKTCFASISNWSVIQNDRLNPHVCKKCGVVSWVASYEKFKLLCVQTMLFWLFMIVPIYCGVIGWFVIPAVILSGVVAFKFTIGRPDVKRLYGPSK